MRHITFIINPVSGFNKTKRKLKDIIKDIYDVEPSAKVILTHHRMHAIALAKDALIRGAERVVAVGGDGTLNEVINGYFSNDGTPYNPRASIAIVPCGMGSDFFRGIGEGRDLKDAIHFAITGKAKPTDVGQVLAFDANGTKIKRYFINISSLGLSGLALSKVKAMPKSLGPTLTYFLAALKTVNQFRSPTILITDEKQQHRVDDCALVGIANGQYFGSGMKLAPHASLDDGLLDLVAVQHLTMKFFLMNAHKLYQGTHLELENVHAWKKSKITIEALSSDPIYIETDGELFAQLPAEYSVKHQALLMVR